MACDGKYSGDICSSSSWDFSKDDLADALDYEYHLKFNDKFSTNNLGLIYNALSYFDYVPFNTKDFFGGILSGLSPEKLNEIATKSDEIALAFDMLAESIVLGHVAVGTAGGLSFEGNPVEH
jgi:hypothetical protein